MPTNTILQRATGPLFSYSKKQTHHLGRFSFLLGLFLCLLHPYNSYSQIGINSKKQVDSITALPIDSTLSWMRSNQYDNVDTYLQIGFNTLNRAQATKDALKLAEVHEELANWHGYHGLYPQDSVVHHSEKTLKYYQKTGNKSKVAASFRVLAIDYLNQNELAKAQTVLFKALKGYEELKDEQGMAKVYRVLSDLHEKMLKPEEAIKYALQAITLFKKAENHSATCVALFNLTKAYTTLGEYDKAYLAADECIRIVETKIPDEIFILTRAYSYRSDISIKTKNYDQALADCTKAYELAVEAVGEERAATYRTEIGNALKFKGKYTEAIVHFKVGIEALEKEERETIWKVYMQVSDCYEQLNDQENALVYYKKAVAMRDKVMEDKVANLETEAVIKYETGKKDEALAAQAIVLAEKNKVQRLIIGIGALLLVLLGVVLFFLKKSRRATAEISAKNAENELLLKEIHHRVKNNLEMVKSLIALQSAQLEDSATKDAMIASQNRVQSMGIIHQKLYQGTNLGSIEMKDYFINLGEGILDTFNAENKVKIACAMEDLELDVDTAVPIGLIVNELLTNALKYAFPKDTKGRIEISLAKPNTHTLTLKVTDNGIGKQQGLAPIGTGFGSQLISLLTQQLNGKMEEETKNGTSVYFQFKMDTAA